MLTILGYRFLRLYFIVVRFKK